MPATDTDTATGTITIYQREIELGTRGAYGSILSLEPMPMARGTGLYLGESFPVATVAVPAGCVVSGGLVRIDRDPYDAPSLIRWASARNAITWLD